MLTNKKLPIWFLAALACSLALSLFSLLKRNSVESANKSVTLSSEFETIENLGASQGLSAPSAITQLKHQGLGGVVLTEETVGELIQRGQITIQNTSVKVPGMGPDRVASLAFDDATQIARVQKGLQIRLGALAGDLTVRNNIMAVPPVSVGIIRSTSVGINPEQAAEARKEGLLIVARFGNPTGISSRGIKQTLQWAHDLGARVFLPVGDQVLGRRDSLGVTEDALRQLDMMYASPEFAKIGGDQNITMEVPELVVRLHSAMQAELDKLTYTDAVDRYGRAARERNMRILLLRPVSLGADQPLTTFGGFIKDVGDQVQREGGTLGIPTPFREPGLPRFWPILIALAAAPVVWFVAAAFVSNHNAKSAGAVVLALASIAAWTHFGAQIDALFIGVSFPVAGFLVLSDLRPRNLILGFLLVSAFSLLGGLCVAAMLNGLIFYIQAEEFRGVKVSVFLPILVVGAMFMARNMGWKNTLRNPITWGAALLGFVILGALAFMIARTGNDTGAGASPQEMFFRGILDRVLFVRPRTKEFLVGHPLLMVGIGLLGLFWKRKDQVVAEGGVVGDDRRSMALASWSTLMLMVGAVGQTSIINTLSHIHIPVVLSVARIGIGLLLGCVIGLILWVIVLRLLPREEA